MHATKSEILALLKRSDGATVDELSTSLGLAPMTVRQHLVALERDGLVSSDEVRRPTGRPHYRYRLTSDGHRKCADGYDRLVTLLVEGAGALNGAETSEDARRRALFRRAASMLAARHRAELMALLGDERVGRLVAILRSHGGFAEYHVRGDECELRDFSCVFRANVGGGGRCDWHETFLEEALGEPVRAAPPPGDGCADCCNYIITLRAETPAGRGQP